MIFTFNPAYPPFHVKIPLACSWQNSVHVLMPYRRRRTNYHLKSWTISPIFNRGTFPGFRSSFLSVSCYLKEEIESTNDRGVNFVKSENCIAKSLFVAFFCVAIVLLPVQKMQFRALALSDAVAEVRSEWNEVEEKNPMEFCWSDHEYESCTGRLLETASVLLSKIEAKSEKITDVEKALKEVAVKKGELEEEIINRLWAEVKLLKSKKHDLNNRSRNLLISLIMMRWERKLLIVKARIVYLVDKINSRIREVDGKIYIYEKEIEEIRQKVGEIDDFIVMKERMAIDVGLKELNFIWKQCEELVEEISRKIWSTKFEGIPKTIPPRQTISNIQKELEIAQKKYWQQLLLPHILEEEFFDSSENSDLYLKDSSKDRSKYREKLEEQIQNDVEKFKAERKLVNGSDEIVRDYPHVALKRLFGAKEVIDSKATNIDMCNGFEVVQAGQNNNLLNTDDKQSLIQRVVSVTMERDIVVQKTWYNEKSGRWEMDLATFSYAVSNNLIKKARIRRDWGAMYVTIKGDDIEYFVNPKEFDFQIEEFGGFEGLYSRMIVSRIPITIEYMKVPWSELNLNARFCLGVEFIEILVKMWWRSKIMSYMKNWTYSKLKNLSDDWLMMIVFPVIDLVIPIPMRMQLGMACQEGIEKNAASTWYLRWQSEIETSFMSRKTDDVTWIIKFTLRSILFISVSLYIIQLITKVPEAIFGSDEKRNREFLKMVLNLKIKVLEESIKDGKDPIKNVFDEMKRIKHPPIKLNDFASIEHLRDEINEVVAFLRKPSAFKEIGARPPRGVLIVGESGTGKTSLALAIAAEAKVPVVEVKAKQLEAGNWVGQGASNIRELFQTARDLAPVIIFVEDFDNFAGVRGKYIHTKMQDHEAFINQLLVELDGFQKQEGVLLMATTNSLSNIDEALKRPGRIDRVFHLQIPTVAEREKILLIAAAENMDPYLIDLVDWKKVAQYTDYLRPVSLKQVPVSIEINAVGRKRLDTNELLSHAVWVALLSGCMPRRMLKTRVARIFKRMIFDYLGLTLTKEDIESVVNEMQSSTMGIPEIEIAHRPVDWSKATKFPHAVWASGRGLIALLLPDFDKVESIWIEPKHWQGMGCTKITRAGHETSTRANFDTKLYLEKKLVFYFASYVASQLLICSEDQNTLCLSELKQAEELATKMVIQFGWGSDYFPTVYSHVVETQNKPHIPVNGDRNVVSSVSLENESVFDTETGESQEVPTLSMGGEYRDEIASRIHKLYNLAFEKAEKMLKNNQKLLMETVEALIEFNVLLREDLERLIKIHKGVREDHFSLTGRQNIEPGFRKYIERDGSAEPVKNE